MQKLTTREEEYMQVIWDLGTAFIKDIIAELPEPKPHYNSVATIVKILEDKGFLAHNTFGKTHQYFPVITKESYQQLAMGDVITNYFDSSYMNVVTYFAKKEKISAAELEKIVELIKRGKQ